MKFKSENQNEQTARLTVTVKEKDWFVSDNFFIGYLPRQNDSEKESETAQPEKPQIPWYRRGDLDRIVGKAAHSMYGLDTVYTDAVDYEREKKSDLSKQQTSAQDMDTMEFVDDDDFGNVFAHILDVFGSDSIENTFTDDDFYDGEDADEYGEIQFSKPHDSDTEENVHFTLRNNSLAQNAHRGENADTGDVFAWRSDGGKYGRSTDGIPMWGNGSFELRTDGKIKFTGDEIEIIYDESEITGEKESLRRIVFNVRTPEIVIMEQETKPQKMSINKNRCTIEKGKRHYMTDGMLREGDSMAVCTKSDGFLNTLGRNGGEFAAEYTTEYNGSRHQTVTYRIKVDVRQTGNLPCQV